MTFIRTALTLALVASLAVPATAGGIGGIWLPTLTWADDAAPAETDTDK